MRAIGWSIAAVLVGCTSSGGPVGVDPDEATPDGGTRGNLGTAVPDVRCAGAPDAGPAGAFRHIRSTVIAALGDPRHRGFDLIAPADAASQELEGWISYTVADKALEDEDVDLFACHAGAWQRIGTTRTDGEGHFALALPDTRRLPIGMRDLFVSVVGDRTGVGFLGYVAPAGTPLVVSDVDGTLTSSENAFLETIVLGVEPDAQLGAAQVFATAEGAGRQLVYVTARGGQYTTATRTWLDHRGFPRGPVRLAPSFVTLPGDDTVAYKTRTIAALSAAGFSLASGVGNRASDIAAYAATGVAADHIFIKLPEFQGEVQPALDAHQAVGFLNYSELAGAL